jgi:hypothetical protein
MSLFSDPNSHSEVVDIFTKSFIENKFSELRAMLGVVETTEWVTFGHSEFFFLFFLGGGGGVSHKVFPLSSFHEELFYVMST